MKITVNSQLLAQELRLLIQVVPVKAVLPVLMNVLIQAEGENAWFLTTNMEVGVSSSCAAVVEVPGAVTLPAKKLLNLVEQVPDGDVVLIGERGSVVFLSGAFKSRLQTLPAEEFPTMPEAPVEGVTLTLDPLKHAVKRVRSSVPDSGKHVVMGALLSFFDGGLALVGTSGKSLALASMTTDVKGEEAVLPVKLLDALTLLEGHEVVFSQTEKHLFFVAEHRTLFATKMVAKFPSYQRVIPKGNDLVAVVDRAQLAAAVRRAGTISEENFFSSFTLLPGALEISSESAGVGHAEEEVPTTYQGEMLSVNCSWRSVLDFLEAASGATITLSLKDQQAPMLLTDGESYLVVVVLLR